MDHLSTELLPKLVRMRDPVGVLSIYVNAAPGPAPGGRPVWEESVRTRLAGLSRGRHGAAVRACLHRLEPAIARAFDPSLSGRGRAVFAAVADGAVHEVRIRPELVTDVWLADRAHIAPLAGALADGSAVGLMTVSMAWVRVLELRLGEVTEISRLDVAPARFDWSLLKEPAHARNEDRRRIEAAAVDAVLGAARRRGWTAVVVAGAERVTGAVAEHLAGQGLRVRCVRFDPAPEHTPAMLATELGPAAAELRREEQLSLVGRILDDSRSDGRAAAGLAAVLQGLRRGQVERLVLDGGRSLPGAVTPDGLLLPAGVAGPAAPADGLRAVPDLSDHLLEAAFETDAGVSVVSGRAAGALALTEGVAARLRW